MNYRSQFQDTFEGQRDRPHLVRIAAPEGLPVSVEEARLHLRLDHEDDDVSLETYLQAAADMLDGPEGRLGRALVIQTWEQRQRRPVYRRVELALGPQPQLISISYLDMEDVERPLSVERFRLIDLGDQAYVEPRAGHFWPTDLADRPDALRVRFSAGQSVADLPETIKQAVRLIAGHWYEQREATAVVEMKEIPIGAETLINIAKVHGWAG